MRGATAVQSLRLGTQHDDWLRGCFDSSKIEVEIVCKDIQQLRFVLHDELQKIKGIERTETLISLEESFSRNVRVV